MNAFSERYFRKDLGVLNVDFSYADIARTIDKSIINMEGWNLCPLAVAIFTSTS